jgi:hypothetical protein
MRGLLKAAKQAKGAADDLGEGCAVDACPAGRDEVVRLVGFDPIDHGDSFVPLCASHVEWAEKRNELARKMRDELRAARREVGQANADHIREVRNPPGGELDEALSLSVAEDVADMVATMAGVDMDEVVEP